MEQKYPLSFCVKAINSEVRKNSRSGGIFTVLSDFVLNKHGVIYGCKLDKDFNVLHGRATDFRERDFFRGSKYVESNMKDCFLQVKEDLMKNRYVLFSGTTCQVSGLLSFLRVSNINMEKLITVDIVCHGVPSPKVWKDYVQWMENKWKNKLESFNFRNKDKFGWVAHIEKAKVNGKYYDINKFTQLFHMEVLQRPSCYHCKFKGLQRSSDITLADFWGIDKVLPKFNDGKGVSLVFLNSEKGKRLFDNCAEYMNCQEIPLEKCLQSSLLYSYDEPANRKEFWNDYENHGLDYVLNKFTLPDKKNKVFMRKAFLRNKVPRWFKNIVIHLKNMKS